MPTTKLHAAYSVALQVINPFSISYLTDMGWLYDTEYLFFIYLLHTHTHTHYIGEGGWDKGIHFHANTKTASCSLCHRASDKLFSNITHYQCGTTWQHWVSFCSFLFLLNTHTNKSYKGRGMRQENTLTRQEQNCMQHVVSPCKW